MVAKPPLIRTLCSLPSAPTATAAPLWMPTVTYLIFSSRIMRRPSVTAFSTEPPMSAVTTWKGRPFRPPAALASSTAIWKPVRMLSAMKAKPPL